MLQVMWPPAIHSGLSLRKTTGPFRVSASGHAAMEQHQTRARIINPLGAVGLLEYGPSWVGIGSNSRPYYPPQKPMEPTIPS